MFFVRFSHKRENGCHIEKTLPRDVLGPSKWRPGASKMLPWRTKMNPTSSKMEPLSAKMCPQSVQMGIQMGNDSPTCCSKCSHTRFWCLWEPSALILEALGPLLWRFEHRFPRAHICSFQEFSSSQLPGSVLTQHSVNLQLSWQHPLLA